MPSKIFFFLTSSHTENEKFTLIKNSNKNANASKQRSARAGASSCAQCIAFPKVEKHIKLMFFSFFSLSTYACMSCKAGFPLSCSRHTIHTHTHTHFAPLLPRASLCRSETAKFIEKSFFLCFSYLVLFVHPLYLFFDMNMKAIRRVQHAKSRDGAYLCCTEYRHHT